MQGTSVHRHSAHVSLYDRVCLVRTLKHDTGIYFTMFGFPMFQWKRERERVYVRRICGFFTDV